MTPVPVPAEQHRLPLRRATYVHVSDLISAYNIDHLLLEKELKRVKTESTKANLPDEKSQTKESQIDVDPSRVATELDVALATSPQKRLQPPRGGYNLCVLVGQVNVVVDKRRVDGSRVRLAEVEIGDETGTVSLRARDEQIDVLAEVSKRLGAAVLRNCTLELYQGRHVRLAVTKWGKLCVYPDNIASTPPPPSKMNSDRNFSLIDLSIVASEMVDEQSDGAYSEKQKKSSIESSEAMGGRISSKSGGQSHLKQQFHSARRGNRDRRQSRGKSGGSQNQTNYIAGRSDRGMMQPQSLQMGYSGMHSFSNYEQGADIRQFPFHHGQQQDVLLPGSAQHIMLQQQYEMQQRQLHQLYTQGQDSHLQNMHQGQTTGMVLQPGHDSRRFAVGATDSMVMPLATSNSIFMPIGLPTSSLQSNATSGASRTQEATNLATSSETSAGKQNSAASNRTSRSPLPSQLQQAGPKAVSPDGSTMAGGRMNPDATSFAPTTFMTSQPYFQTFHPSQTPPGIAYAPPPQRPPVVHVSTAQEYAPNPPPSGQTTPSPDRNNLDSPAERAKASENSESTA